MVYGAGGVALAAVVAAVGYFPRVPPNAPSRSAGVPRQPFGPGFKMLARHGNFWLIALAYGVMTGTFSAWGSYLEPNLQAFLPESKAENVSGWIGFYSTVAGCIGSIGFGIFADALSGRMKVWG